MFTLIAQVAHMVPGFISGLLDRSGKGDDVAHQLMEDAEARAGLNPRQARELRRAARAYLRVVR